MKKYYLKLVGVLFFITYSSILYSQNNKETPSVKDGRKNDTSKVVDDNVTKTFTPPFQIGLGLGFNFATKTRNEYYISATNNTLQKDGISKNSFVGSVVVAYAIPWHYKQIGKNGEPIGETYAVPGPISILSSFNLSELNSSLSFNTSLNGGLGIGFNIHNVMHLGLFCDFTKGRFLRDAYTDSIGKKIIVGGTPLTSIDKSDDRFYKDGLITSFSFKVIFIINRRNSDITITSDEDKLNKAIGLQQ